MVGSVVYQRMVGISKTDHEKKKYELDIKTVSLRFKQRLRRKVRKCELRKIVINITYFRHVKALHMKHNRRAIKTLYI